MFETKNVPMNEIQVHTTTDYSLFKFINGNRDVNQLHLTRLKESIKKNHLITIVMVNENFEIIRTGLSRLLFVEISLERGKDDPQRIFESLNSTGLELSQADLIRNYILMGLNRKDQNKIYQNYWEVIEKLAKDETSSVTKVSDFIRDYLTLVNNNIPNKQITSFIT